MRLGVRLNSGEVYGGEITHEMGSAMHTIGGEFITVDSQGGIGNQLFIYAFARALEIRSGNSVVLDTWRHKLGNGRDFEIGELIGTQLPVIDTSSRLPYVFADCMNYSRHWRQKFAVRINRMRDLRYETALAFDGRLLSSQPGSHLVGYFQSWKYFADVADTLRIELLRSRSSLLGGSAQRMGGNSVAVHVRMGDFLLPRHEGTHNTLNHQYYESAFRAITYSKRERHFVLFSDEPERAEHMLKNSISGARMQPHQSLGSDLLDFLYMSTFGNIVCANSTYSWWAAWLSGLPGSNIIVPRNWMNRRDFRIEDLIPDSWTVI